LKALGVQQPARNLRASDSILRTDLRVFGDIGLDTPLRIDPHEEAWKDKHPKKRIFEHFASLASFQVKPCCPDGLMSNE
jgi:Tat protein secretion system quality control protein TatD with DNase activity